jgi:hypothetical protein
MFDYVQKGGLHSMKHRISVILLFSFLLPLLSGCTNDTDLSFADSGNDLPFYAYSLYCLHIEDQKSDQEILEYMDNIPSYSVSKRFYTGEDLGYKDSFKMAEDGKFLYIKLFYENVYEHSESKNKQHVLLFRAQNAGIIHTVPVVYYEDRRVNLEFKQASERIFGTADIQTRETEEGFEAFVKIPLQDLEIDLDKLQMNVLRIDWGANPMASYFPVESSYFFDSSGNAIHVVVFLGDQGRFVNVKYSDSIKDKDFERPQIEIKCIGVNKQQIFVKGIRNDYRLLWETPEGKTAELSADIKRGKGVDVLTFEHPPVSEEGVYRIHLGDKKETVLCVEKRFFIQAANQNVIAEEIEKKDVDINKISDRAKLMLDIVPPYAGIITIPDPKDTTLWPYSTFSYSILNPYHIKSNKTGDLYPDPDQFPETNVARIDNGNGRIVEYPYYLSPDGAVCYLTPALWAGQKEYVLVNLPELAKSDPAGAAYVLAKICEHYPDYSPAIEYYFTSYPIPKAAGPPYAYYGGFWTRWFYGDLYMVASVAEAYAEVRKTNALDKLRAETGRDLEKEILEIIQEGIDISDSYGIQNTNMDASQWEGLIRIGKALNNPDYIHRALERIEPFIRNNYLFDGFWMEVTLSYHRQITGGLYRVLSLITNYSDPEGYIYPGTGKRIDRFRFLELFPILRQSQAVTGILSFPNGRYPSVQDTHATDYGSTVPQTLDDILMPASGIARLTGNTNALKNVQTHALMLFTPKYGHNHDDALSMTLHAYGVEVLPDLGYTHTYNRAWTISTLSHNTVTVNKMDSRSKDGGNILRFVPSNNSVGVVRAYDPEAYPEIDIYDREMIFVPLQKDGPEGYVLDIFRVKGGTCHEYSLNMCADYDYNLSTDVAWEDASETMLPEGVKYVKPASETSSGDASGHYKAYMYVQDVQSAPLENRSFSLSYEITDVMQEGAGLKILGAKNSGTLLLGKAPSMRATRQKVEYDTNDRCDDYFMDKMVLRREGEDVSSVFVTLLEPFSRRYPSRVRKIEKLEADGLGEFDVAVKVVTEEYTDYIFSAYQEPIRVEIDSILFQGRCGFVRVQDKKVLYMEGMDAEMLRYGELSLTENRSCEGVIQKVYVKSRKDSFNGFATDIKPEEGLKGKYIIVMHPDGTTNGYEIKKITEEDGQFIVDIGDMEPGFQFTDEDSTEMTHYPFKKREGTVRFVIYDVQNLRP